MRKDEVSTGSGSDRVRLTNSTVAELEDPVATAPGTDLIVALDNSAAPPN
jgi:hypothetical protein